MTGWISYIKTSIQNKAIAPIFALIGLLLCSKLLIFCAKSFILVLEFIGKKLRIDCYGIRNQRTG